MYCSDLLYFFARYFAETLLGILTKDSSLLYLVVLQGVSHTQKSLSRSTRKSGEKTSRGQWCDDVKGMTYTCVCLCTWEHVSVWLVWISSSKIQGRHCERHVSPRAGSAHSLYSSGVQYGASPAGTKPANVSLRLVQFTWYNSGVVSYRACAPCGSCSCPPGSAFRSRCGRLWCCSCQRSRSPWASLCSPPTVGGGIWAVTQGKWLPWNKTPSTGFPSVSGKKQTMCWC